jgi:Flp pilus assembly protein TadG
MNAMRRRLHNESGAAAVEFALILPILLLFVMGIIEFGFIFNRWITVTHAAREGVRVAVVGGVDPIGAAQQAAPDLTSDTPMTCTMPLPETSPDVQMTCSVESPFALWIFSDTITLESTAQMRKEGST